MVPTRCRILNSFGAFAFSSDALTWSATEVRQQNLVAWLKCEGQALFIHTGCMRTRCRRGGCVDETVSVLRREGGGGRGRERDTIYANISQTPLL